MQNLFVMKERFWVCLCLENAVGSYMCPVMEMESWVYILCVENAGELLCSVYWHVMERKPCTENAELALCTGAV